MEIQIRVYRNAECLSKNEPCLCETVEVDGFFNFSGCIDTFKQIWPDCSIVFNI